ncbi:hypothetical protein CDD83_6459 [Cordyceps sp. RAO-2017]|nr:hypothetical protein CDD83_6459 [Cordyceps sp. RAO-2017]
MPVSSPQLGIVNLLAPGLSNLGLENLVAWGFESYATLFCLLGLLTFCRSYISQLRSWLKDHFTSTIYISRTDESYEMLLSWVSSRGLDNAAQSIIARVGKRGLHEDGSGEAAKKPLVFSPWNGSFFFSFRNNLLSYRTELRDNGIQKEEEISITCFGRSPQVLKNLLQECRVEYLSQIKNKTTIFEHRGNSWAKVMARDIRPLSTVIVNEKQKQRLVGDVRGFLDPHTRNWFTQRAIPYRRGYLLYGPPGTGKSSFSLSVAGEFGLDIFIVNIPSVDDQTLQDLLSRLPDKCVVLLEDIDAVGMARAPQTRDRSPDKPATPRWPGTLSGLLNSLDGVASQEGRILIMTTNHVEKLDEALVRPGRVDVKAHFPLADTSLTDHIFQFMFERRDLTTEADSKGHVSMASLAAEFASKVPAHEFSPAEIISYLLRCRHSPTDAVSGAEQWVQALRSEKLENTQRACG